MATDAPTKPIRLEPAIDSLLSRLRRRIRAYVCVDGVAAVVTVLGAGFWLSLAVDWLFELPVALRVAMLACVGAVATYVAYRSLAARLMVRLADANMALLLERRFGQFHDSLLTAVELAERPDHAAAFNAEMIGQTHRVAVANAAGIDLVDVFNTGPLVRRVTLAVALAGSVLLTALVAVEAMGVWARRNLLLSAEQWPRDTHLLVEGFEQGRVKIARGADWLLSVKADAAPGREVPEVVEVRYTTDDGARGRENMSREGVVLPGQGAFQPYALSFKSVLSPLEFYVLGGDDREGPYYLDVVESPTISKMVLHCEYPAYMRRASREVPVAGLMQLPRGTRITIRAEANKPLVAAHIDDVTDDNAPHSEKLDLVGSGGAPVQRFEYNIPQLDADKILLFTLLDTDGIRSLEAVRLALSAVADEPPQVNVQLQGIGTAITAKARLPAAGQVSDDYGVARVWFEFHPDDAAAQERPFAVAAAGQEKLAVSDALEVEPLGLAPKQKLHVAVQAADDCALEGGANRGTSQRYVLEVVTPEQLRSMLEARELMLRRRFETIIEEFTHTRDLLAGVELAAAKPAAEGAAPDAPQPREPAAPGAAVEESDAAATEPGYSPAAVQVGRAGQNVERSAHETRDVAEAFGAIREEMINNRVDTEELKIRLKEGVADPLQRIVALRFPPLQAELGKLAGQLADVETARATRSAAVGQMDAILVEMKQVLDKMLELETFNEVLDMLRQIIDEQEKVNSETKEQQKAKLRELVE
jgi:hypothetical protein